MIFDLTKVDFTKEITSQLKIQYHEIVNDLIENKISENNDVKKVTLFHGTSLYYLNSILMSGIIPRKDTELSNFEGDIKSNPNLIYLTSKWHYWYAYNTFKRIQLEKKGEEIFNLPCYLDCEISSNKLIIDEDFFHSKYILSKVKNCIRRNQPLMEITWNECLGNYGTVAHIGEIKRGDILNFSVLAGLETLIKNFIDEKSVYNKEFKRWGAGKNKGKLTTNDLFRLEDDKLNLFFQMKDIPEDSVITEFLENKETGSYKLKFNKIIK